MIAKIKRKSSCRNGCRIVRAERNGMLTDYCPKCLERIRHEKQ